MIEPAKIAGLVVVSDELLNYCPPDLMQAVYAERARWERATPEERAQWAADAKAALVAERENAEHVDLTLEALGEKLGWSTAYLEHLVQPYCGCFDGSDGWEYCQHARDLGLAE